jgi:hypothetical protein
MRTLELERLVIELFHLLQSLAEPQAIRRGPTINAGLLWGAYHFLRPVSIPSRVDFFLKIAAPDNMTLLALDHEDERVPLIDAKEFLLRVEHAVGRKAVLYSGS